MMIELAVGDSYGAAFEYSPLSFIEKHNTGVYYSKHPRHATPPGFYTDDTQMTLAIAEALISGERWNLLNLANRFVEVFKRDPRTGYAGSFYNFLKDDVTNGKEFLAKIRPTSDKSGAAMRTTPIGLCPTLGEVTEKATLQAKITHDTPDGIGAALAASYLVFYFHKDVGPIDKCPGWIGKELGLQWAAPWDGKVKTKGWMSVRAAITAVARNTSLTDLLIDCVSFTGDVDTVATIALAAASLSEDYEQDLEESLILGLENMAYGRNYLQMLDEQLFEKYG
jgi:ADP-ribosylglycohydrolase